MSDNQQELDIITNATGIGPSALENFEKKYQSVVELGSDTPQEISDKVSGVGYSTAVNVLKYLEKEGLREESSKDEELERLVELLQDLFEFDKEDRDFGIYKLMNANRDEIDAYIKNDLVDKIENEVSNLHNKFGGKSREEVREDVIDELGAKALEGDSLSKRALNMIDDRTEGPDKQELENIRSEIYNYIYQFFSHYYDSGDFINRRRRTHQSKPYSVPYDGSNTNFHWVTKNQYYSKTSEQFTRFTFKLNGYQYCFKTVSSELDGSGIGNSEYFVMCNPSEIEANEDTVVIPFYRRMIGDDDLVRFDISSSTRNKQSKMNEMFADEIDVLIDKKDIPVSRESIVEKIDEYTNRNQNDFFIHKNIEKFLSNELEEYVKSEIVGFHPKSGIKSISDLDVEKGRIVTEIVMDIISFVSQLEEFKRKLFEKKKFVRNSEKLVQVKNIPDENYGRLLENEEQVSDWEESFGIDSSNLVSENLESHPYSEMMVDTTYFEEDITTGKEPENKLIKGDNYQALNFLQEKYKNSVKCIYIDPPYNTGNANFAYKDNYQRPTWLSMMYDRIQTARSLLKEDGIVFVSIDSHEMKNVRRLMDSVFSEDNLLSELVWNLGNGINAGHFVRSHEYIIAYAKNKDALEYFEYKQGLESLHDFDSDYIIHSAVTTIDDRHPPREIYFPEGSVEYKGDSKVVKEGETIGEAEQTTVKEGDLVFKNGELAEDVVLEAGWKMASQIEEWLETGSARDSKGQKVVKFFFNQSGKLMYKKERGTIHPRTVLDFPSTQRGRKQVVNVFGGEKYSYPKPVEVVKNLINLTTNSGDIVMDFFAGSGTTAQAVQELNRERDEQVNYIMVEMLDEAFDITEERVKRTAFSKEWKDGKPQVDKQDSTELNASVECIELESYEEALDAVQFEDTQKTINRFNETTLNYLLEFGTGENPVFLNSDQLSNPLEYKLSGSVESESVDVMTTFNYLIGLQDYRVKNKTISEVDYTIYEGHIDEEPTLVIWRHKADMASYEKESEELDWEEYDNIYINGDSSIEKSKPIAPTFSRKMNVESNSMLD